MAEAPVPIRTGTFQDMRAVRAFFERTGYTEAQVCEQMQVPALPDLMRSLPAPDPLVDFSEPARALAEVLLVGRAISRDALHRLVPEEPREVLFRLGVLAPYGDNPETFAASVALYPVKGLYIASDRWFTPAGLPVEPFADIVYPAIVKNTFDFLEALPELPCERLLDVGTGSGIGALTAARYSKHVWASDITERSRRFAAFNAELNGIANVTACCGDLYAPVEELRFDRIIAHPSYMPVLKSRGKGVFYDGGEDGEWLTRRIVEGLPAHLNPGGRLYCVCLGLDYEENSFERRVREWLREEAGRFDIFVLARRVLSPQKFALESSMRDCGGVAMHHEWCQYFERRHVEQLVLNCLVVRQVEKPRPGFTARRDLATQSTPAEVEWLLDWEKARATLAPGELLSGARLKVSQFARLDVSYDWRTGSISPSRFILRADYPFLTESQIQGWAANLLNLVDGSRTAEELFVAAKESKLVAAETPFEEFADYLAALVSGGFLTREEMEPPRARAAGGPV